MGSLIRKISIAQFINSALIFYFIFLLDGQPLGSISGLIIEITTFVALNGLFHFIINLIYFPHLAARLGTWLKYRNVRNDQTVPTFQILLNE